MEPTNRPYVDPDTEPGDAGTEPSADDRADAESEEPTKLPTRRGSWRAVREGAAIEGSPADQS